MDAEDTDKLVGDAALVELQHVMETLRRRAEENPLSIPAIASKNKLHDYWARLALGVAQKSTAIVREAADKIAAGADALETLQAALAQLEDNQQRVQVRKAMYDQQAKSVTALTAAIAKLNQLG